MENKKKYLKIAAVGVGVAVIAALGIIFPRNSSIGYEGNIAQPFTQVSPNSSQPATTTEFVGDVNPQENDSFDLGSPTNSWQDIHASGTIFIGTISADSIGTEANPIPTGYFDILNASSSIIDSLTITTQVISPLVVGGSASSTIQGDGATSTLPFAKFDRVQMTSSTDGSSIGYFESRERDGGMQWVSEVDFTVNNFVDAFNISVPSGGAGSDRAFSVDVDGTEEFFIAFNGNAFLGGTQVAYAGGSSSFIFQHQGTTGPTQFNTAASGMFKINGGNFTTGFIDLFEVEGAPSSGITATEERHFTLFDNAFDWEWEAGNIAEQSFNFFSSTTASVAGGGGTFTDISTVTIQGAPDAGTGATFINPMAFWVQDGLALFQGDLHTSGTMFMGSVGSSNQDTQPGDVNIGGQLVVDDEIFASSTITVQSGIFPASHNTADLGVNGTEAWNNIFASGTIHSATSSVYNATATTTLIIQSGETGLGGRTIYEDVDGDGCTEVTTLNGVVSAKIVACL